MWHILFQAFLKYHLHSKHLNKILFEIVNFGFLCKTQPRRALLSYPFHNMAAHTEATPTGEGI